MKTLADRTNQTICSNSYLVSNAARLTLIMPFCDRVAFFDFSGHEDHGGKWPQTYQR